MTTAAAYARLADQAKRNEAVTDFMRHWKGAWPHVNVELSTTMPGRNGPVICGGPRDGVTVQAIIAYINSDPVNFFAHVAEFQDHQFALAKQGAGL